MKLLDRSSVSLCLCDSAFCLPGVIRIFFDSVIVVDTAVDTLDLMEKERDANLKCTAIADMKGY